MIINLGTNLFLKYNLQEIAYLMELNKEPSVTCSSYGLKTFQPKFTTLFILFG